MSQIRIFINSFGLEALLVPEEDLYSFCVFRDEYVEQRIEQMKTYVPVGFHLIGILREKTWVTYKCLRDGVSPKKIPIPANIDKLGFDFDPDLK
jgi:hypothetical protein